MTGPDFSPGFLAELDTLFEWRRDVRRFRRDPVADDVMTQLLKTACLAPSVGNAQPWRFVRVKSAPVREAVIRDVEAANAEAAAHYGDEAIRQHYLSLKLHGLIEAPEHLAVFCDMAPEAGLGLGRQTMSETLRYSTVMAIHNLWLSARVQGLGVGWVSILHPARVSAILESPADWAFVAYLCVGYPMEEHDDPELERAGWQVRLPLSHFVFEK